MKKILLFISFIVAVVTLSGCTTKTNFTETYKIEDIQHQTTKATNATHEDTIITYDDKEYLDLNKSKAKMATIVIRETHSNNTDSRGRYYEESKVSVLSSTDEYLEPETMYNLRLTKASDKPKYIVISRDFHSSDNYIILK